MTDDFHIDGAHNILGRDLVFGSVAEYWWPHGSCERCGNAVLGLGEHEFRGSSACRRGGPMWRHEPDLPCDGGARWPHHEKSPESDKATNKVGRGGKGPIAPENDGQRDRRGGAKTQSTWTDGRDDRRISVAPPPKGR